MRTERGIAVIGGRISSLACAISLAEAGFSVEVYSPRPVERYSPTDSEGIHIADDRTVLNLLDSLGMPFNRTAEGEIELRATSPTGNHHMAYSGDETGKQIHRILCDQMRRWETVRKIIRRDYQEVLDFILDDNGVCRGLVSLDLKSMEVSTHVYDAVILAVGGPIAAFGESTGASDDFAPMVSAYLHGAKWIDPHSFEWDTKIDQYLSDWMEKEAGNGTERKPHFISKPFAKRHTGGLQISKEFQTNIPHLFAAGECAYLNESGGILPCNDLIFDVLSGLDCASSVQAFIDENKHTLMEINTDALEKCREDTESRLIDIGPAKGDVIDEPWGDKTPVHFYRELAGLMQRAVGPNRTQESLEEADSRLWGDIRPRFPELRPSDRIPHANRDIPFIHRLGLLITACETIIRSAHVALVIEEDSSIFAEWSDEGPNVQPLL